MRAQRRGCANVVAREASLLDVRLEDETFDVIWSNGVLHHTGDTDGSLKEFTHLLRPGGWMWLYLYGSGGIYWHMVDWVREMLAPVDVSTCIAQLRLQNVPVRRIGEWIDDWFGARAPALHRRRRPPAPRGARLRRCHRADPGHPLRHLPAPDRRLPGGDRADGRRRRALLVREDGSVRAGQTRPRLLPDAPDGKGSFWQDGPAVTAIDPDLARIRGALEKLETVRGDGARAYRIMVCGRVHAETRSRLEAGGAVRRRSLPRAPTGHRATLRGVRGPLLADHVRDRRHPRVGSATLRTRACPGDDRVPGPSRAGRRRLRSLRRRRGPAGVLAAR